MPNSGNTRPAEAGDDVIGSLIGGRYRALAAIGRGGMAVVYRAEDTQLPREVAVKLMAPGSADADDVSRQRNEIDTLAALQHYALVGLIDAGVDHSPSGERAFLVMELVDGPTLRDVRPSPLPAEEVAHIGADIAEALHYMHSKGVVHRDIKPANILLARSELPDRMFHAKLADLGIARLVDGARLTSTGIVLGTAHYLSPEQARGSAVGPATDVYSLGLVLLEALTGQVAFPGAQVEALGARLLHGPALPESLDGGWRDLLTRMTAMDPAARPLPMEVAVTARNRSRTSDAAVAGGPAEMTGPAEATVFAETTGSAQTTVLAEHGDVVGDSEPTGNTGASASGGSTAPTVVLGVTSASGVETESGFLTQVMTAPASSSQPRDVPAARHGRQGKRSRGRLWAWIAAAAIVVAAGGGALAWATAPAPAPTSSPSYPAVPGTLGTHLKQLQESVTP